MSMKKTVVSAAIGAAIGVGMAAAPLTASAAVLSFDFSGQFRMLDPAGGGLENTSQPNGKTGNNFSTPVGGTVQFDTATGSATALMDTFQFFNGNPTLPATAGAISFQAIGDGNCTNMGVCGAGNLILANMTFTWNGNFNIPVSLILDATGMFGAFGDGTFFGSMGTPNINATVSGVGVTGAADGTYIGTSQAGKPGVDAGGYLLLGPAPIATLEFNTATSAACTAAGAPCGFSTDGSTPGVGISGVIQAGGVLANPDTAPNSKEYAQGDGVGIGANPMASGPFAGFNANFDITSLRLTGVDGAGSIAPVFTAFENGSSAVVPVPAAVWLFGSGLMGLVGVARRRKV